MQQPIHKKRRPTLATPRGFTLVEIMIVVLIIGILLAIAIPNFISAREASRAKSCIGNLKQIDGAKQQAIMDYKLNQTAAATFSVDGTTPTTSGSAGVYQLVTITPIPGYIRRPPVCPSGGSYNPGGVSVSPTCSITGASGSGYALGEKWYHGY